MQIQQLQHLIYCFGVAAGAGSLQFQKRMIWIVSGVTLPYFICYCQQANKRTEPEPCPLRRLSSAGENNLLPEIGKLHLYFQILPLQQLYRILQIVTVFPDHPHLVILDLGLHLQFAFLDNRNDVLGLFF